MAARGANAAVWHDAGGGAGRDTRGGKAQAGWCWRIAAGRELPAVGRAPVANGPAADYPVVLGDSYAVGNAVFTPSDTMNLDAVGYASVGPMAPA